MRFFLECRSPDGSWHAIDESEDAYRLGRIRKTIGQAADVAGVCIETRQNERGEFLVRSIPRGSDERIFTTLIDANDAAQSRSEEDGVGYEVRDQTDGGDYQVAFFEGESR